MSEIPTFRLGRAVRNFAPVAVIAVLAVPSASFADPGNGNADGHGKGAEKGVGHAGPDNGKEHGGGNASDGPDRNNGNDKPKNKPDKPDKPGKPDKPDRPGNPDKPGKGNDAPTPAPAAAPQAAAPAQVVTTTIPSRAKIPCASRRTITITIGRKSDIRRNSVRINGKKAKTRVRGSKLVATVDLRKLAKGTYKIKTRATMKDGDVKTGTRRYRTCTPKQIAAEKAAKRKAAKKTAKAKARR